jgi:predicted MFS family arabinose efflux permease
MFLLNCNTFPGPAIGAFLYEIGGFKLPFFIVGSFGMVVATGLLFVIPNVKIDERRSNTKSLNYSEVVRVKNESFNNTYCSLE